MWREQQQAVISKTQILEPTNQRTYIDRHLVNEAVIEKQHINLAALLMRQADARTRFISAIRTGEPYNERASGVRISFACRFLFLV
jgi:hypothetical protein